ncbi:hypothetical protein [Corynebacterium aquilae]|uniref:Uncharacterized protein n=1 Tax=Corynebacterium aquilae DSM 44791 TaxID=1431546 RepID=A0A1L7CEA7_9CORY|nr:hypothetical protein [Corynebacterium aquilae]APT84154.1 hypothetical protein CAQU_02680 [Corynebacterium aquilae DSM 44791]
MKKGQKHPRTTRVLSLAATSALLCVAACSTDATTPAASTSAEPTAATSSASSDVASTSSTPTSAQAAAADKGLCDPDTVSADLGGEYDTISDCDGLWAYAALKVAQPVGDTTSIIRFRNGHWEVFTALPVAQEDMCEERVREQGVPERFLGVGNFHSCQRPSEPIQGDSSPQAAPTAHTDAGYYRSWWGHPEMGVPWEMGANGQPVLGINPAGEVSAVKLPDGTVKTEQYPGCDGRGIIIVDSYIETAGDNQQGLADMLAKHPGASFLSPGYCPSLRGSLDGKRIYPVYYDMGYKYANLCEGKASYGGNARRLSETADYSDPCL